MIEKKTITGIIILIILIFILVSVVFLLNTSLTKEFDNVSVSGNYNNMYLIDIADEKGYFTDEKINVTIVQTNSSNEAKNLNLFKKTDLAVIQGYSLSELLMDKQPIKVVAIVQQTSRLHLVGLKSAGIKSLSDLKGKKIAIIPNSSEFYLDRLLKINHVDPNKVEKVYLPIDKIGEAMYEKNDIDACLYWEPYIYEIYDEHEDDSIIFDTQRSQYINWYLACDSDYLENNRELITRFLKALKKSQDYIIADPEDSKEILNKSYGVSFRLLNNTWDKERTILTFGQSSISIINDISRWLVSTHQTDNTDIPDYYDYIDSGPLRNVSDKFIFIPDLEK